MQDTIAYFAALKYQDKDFFYMYDLDEERRVQNLMVLLDEPTNTSTTAYHSMQHT
jgi:hypothetical protein